MEQWLYELLLTHPGLSYAGVCDWNPKRLAMMSTGVTADMVEAAGTALQAARFIYIDGQSDEVLVRSFLRHDGLLKNPKLSVSMANSFGAVASQGIQKVIVRELQKLAHEYPEWAAFRVERVASILKLEGADMGSLLGEGLPQGLGEALPQALPQAFPLPTATATATRPSKEGLGGVGGISERTRNTSQPPRKATRRKPETAIPANWSPTQKHSEYATEKNLALDDEATSFRLHAETHDRRCASWNAAFSSWLRKSKPTTTTARNALWD
ncbi:hypothetical protein [Galactobacter caseinivorans]|uniref:Uncharacterized protein n=1 Tax=Galactobacter caseinivorans TaxID=2676123 RepID=A0A496PMR6_9MICC|nr:hypothetical protein [Galactobacter caseinivorans]RKW71769.1 hypothetical protein DWQ67_02775 [Galactobacter caseinivorans]